MVDRKAILNKFLEEIFRIEQELDNLDKCAYDVSQLYNGTAFEEQEELAADKMENLMIAATHETASQIGFYRNDIENLSKFIEFREKYNDFTDKELMEIIDENVSIELKLILSKRFESIENMMQKLDALKKEWNEWFQNQDYSKLKKQLRIK